MSAETAEKPKTVKFNSRWRKGAERYSTARTVEQTRHVRKPGGSVRRETDSPAEAKFVDRAHEAAGWHRGARVIKVENGETK